MVLLNINRCWKELETCSGTSLLSKSSSSRRERKGHRWNGFNRFARNVGGLDVAATKRNKNGNIHKSIEYNTPRYNISPQLAQIFNQYSQPLFLIMNIKVISIFEKETDPYGIYINTTSKKCR